MSRRDVAAGVSDGVLTSALVEALEERWAIRILWAVMNDAHRFVDIQRQIGASPSVLAVRLRTLKRVGLIRTEPYQAPRARVRQAYHLTPQSAELAPILASLMLWATR